jgi:cyclopropane fatty-acyl-phospholipid synthase-like methyltransferase
MSYEAFAYLYDRLMEDAPYDQWREFSYKKIKDHHPAAKKLLDIGCGTGELLLRFLKDDFDVTGVDLSSDMLTVAQEKVQAQGLDCQLYEQDMRSLEGLGSFDVIVVFCDSLNYLITEEDVKKAFGRFYELLNPNGLLLFDVHSIYKINEIFKQATFAEDHGDLSFIWNIFEGGRSNSVIHELTFFVEDDDGRFSKHEESHIQRSFQVNEYKQWLTDIGFSLISIDADFSQEVTNESERIFFTLKKVL